MIGEDAALELRASVREPARWATAAACRPLEMPVEEGDEEGGCRCHVKRHGSGMRTSSPPLRRRGGTASKSPERPRCL